MYSVERKSGQKYSVQRGLVLDPGGKGRGLLEVNRAIDSNGQAAVSSSE